MNKGRVHAWAPWAAMAIVAVALVNMSLAVIVRNHVLFWTALGYLGGQAAVLAVWAALGPPRKGRFPACALIATALWGAVVAGCVLRHGTGIVLFHSLRRITAFLPLGTLGVLCPLWLLRALAGWRIVPREGEIVVSAVNEPIGNLGAFQFRLRHLLTATLLAALALGMAMELRHNDPYPFRPGLGGLEDAAWIGTAWSAALTPVVWLALRVRRPLAAVAGTAVVAVAATLVILALIHAYFGGIDYSEEFPPYILINGVMISLLFFVLRVARRLGWDLRTGRRMTPTIPSA